MSLSLYWKEDEMKSLNEVAKALSICGRHPDCKGCPYENASYPTEIGNTCKDIMHYDALYYIQDRIDKYQEVNSIIYILYGVNTLLDCENVVGVFSSKEKAEAYLDNRSISYKYNGVVDSYDVSDDEYYYIIEACIDKGVYEA